MHHFRSLAWDRIACAHYEQISLQRQPSNESIHLVFLTFSAQSIGLVRKAGCLITGLP